MIGQYWRQHACPYLILKIMPHIYQGPCQFTFQIFGPSPLQSCLIRISVVIKGYLGANEDPLYASDLSFLTV